ncbi:hypothetical protein BDV19DRAFT_354341 [Aspergillus venezuelensis]
MRHFLMLCHNYTGGTRDAGHGQQQAAMICKNEGIVTNRNSTLETSSSSSKRLSGGSQATRLAMSADWASWEPSCESCPSGGGRCSLRIGKSLTSSPAMAPFWISFLGSALGLLFHLIRA